MKSATYIVLPFVIISIIYIQIGFSQDPSKEYRSQHMGLKLSFPSNWMSASSMNDELVNSMNAADRMIYDMDSRTTGKEVCSNGTKTGWCFISWDNYDNSTGNVYSSGNSWNLAISSAPSEGKDLVQFMRENYKDIMAPYPSGIKSDVVIINDNKSTVGSKYPAWQMEYSEQFSQPDNKFWKNLHVYTIFNNTFYQISYRAGSEEIYSKYLPQVNKVIDSIEFFPAQIQVSKIPSFISANETEQSNPRPMSENNPNGLQILSHNSFTDSVGYMHVVGEVQNNSPTNAEFVQVTGTFYDNNNQVVGTQFTYTSPSDIVIGDKAPFEIILTTASVPVSQVDHYNLIASSK